MPETTGEMALRPREDRFKNITSSTHRYPAET